MFFGVLDAIILLRFGPSIVVVFYTLLSSDFPWFSVYLIFFLAAALLPLSMGFSAYALIRGKKWGLRLNYFQFPARFLIGSFSLSFLTAFPLLPYLVGYQLLTRVMITVEIARLIATIFIHYTTSKNRGWSSPTAQPSADVLTQTDQPTA